METKFKKVVVEDANGNKSVEQQFYPKLVAINTTSPQKYTNAAGEEKVYYLGTLEFTAPDGVTEQKGITTSIHAKSFDHGMKVGENYLSAITRDAAGKLWIRTSHLLEISALDDTLYAGLSFDAIDDAINTAAPATPAAVGATP